MDRDTTFIYTYSAKVNKEIQEIRRKYLPCEKMKPQEHKGNAVQSANKTMKEVTIMNKNDQEFLVQKIRTQYTEKENTEMDVLRELDAKVKRPADVFAYVFGGVAAIIMGSGMSLVMTDIGTAIGISNPLIPGIVIGVAGMLMAIVNYPMYKGILDSRKKRYADQILALSDKLMDR